MKAKQRDTKPTGRFLSERRTSGNLAGWTGSGPDENRGWTRVEDQQPISRRVPQQRGNGKTR